MVRVLLIACTTLALGVSSVAAQRPEDEVLKTVQSLFDGMRARDTALMRSLFHADARLMSADTREGVPRVSVDPLAGWLRGVAGAKELLDERLRDTEVRVDGNLAMVWTAYDLFVGSRHNHCGVDVFILGKTADGWKILDVADTRRKEGCKP